MDYQRCCPLSASKFQVNDKCFYVNKQKLGLCHFGIFFFSLKEQLFPVIVMYVYFFWIFLTNGHIAKIHTKSEQQDIDLKTKILVTYRKNVLQNEICPPAIHDQNKNTRILIVLQEKSWLLKKREECNWTAPQACTQQQKTIIIFLNVWSCCDTEQEDDSHFLLWCILSGSLHFLTSFLSRKIMKRQFQEQV